MITLKKIKAYEKGLLFQDGDLTQVIDKGWFFSVTPLRTTRLELVSIRGPWLTHKDIDLIIKSDLLQEDLEILDIKDEERAIVWVDQKFSTILGAGQYALWKKYRSIKVERVSTELVLFEHKNLETILANPQSETYLNVSQVEQGQEAIFFLNGEFQRILKPGKYAFWKKSGKVSVIHKDLRKQHLDLSGQEIMTKDKVTLRLTAIIHFQISNIVKAVTSVNDIEQMLYREAQLLLRAVVGSQELSQLLEDKTLLNDEMASLLAKKMKSYGIEIDNVGIRDIILPGEMKDLLNKVTEAKKQSEANLICRREEVAALRSQANSAKLLETNPTLMKLKELEVLEKVASSSKLEIMLGEKGLSDRIMKLI